jgi:predicted transposase YbfD/YdcC
MEELIRNTLLSHFDFIADPRVRGRSKHYLIDIIAIVVCAKLSGIEVFEEIEDFGNDRKDWFSKFLDLPNGIPSHDTIRRVLSLIEPGAFESAFNGWVEEMQEKIKRVSVDGKAVKGTQRQFGSGSRPLILVNVFSNDAGISLGQKEAPSTGNAETSAARECLSQLNLEGTLVSMDAGLGKKNLLNTICDKKGNYIVPLKSNLKTCFNELGKYLNKEISSGNFKFASTTEKSHGREEVRECKTVSPEGLSKMFKESFPKVKTVLEVRRARKAKDNRVVIQKTGKDGKQYYEKNHRKWKHTTETIYYVSSQKMSPQQALKEIREHWSIENKLHWSLDVIFDEDCSRIRDKTTARNLALVRKIAFNILQKCPLKISKNRKMKRAARSEAYLEQLLTFKSAENCEF